MALGEKSKTSLAVLVPEIVLAPAAAIGAVYGVPKVAPGIVRHIEKVISEHVVMPHLDWWERRAGSLHKAHEEYDKRKRERLIARGEPVPEKSKPVLTPKERSDVIAGVLTKGAIAFTADIGTTLASQIAISRKLEMKKPLKGREAFVEAAVHLGLAAIMTGPGAVKGENLHHRIRRKLEAHGVEHKKADDIGMAVPYVVLPGYVASAASLLYALVRNGHDTPSVPHI